MSRGILIAALAWLAVAHVAADAVPPEVPHAQPLPAPAIADLPTDAPADGEASARPSGASYEELVRAAIGAQESGDFARAHALFIEAHTQQPSARTLRGMGVASFQGGYFTRAIGELEAALRHSERPLAGDLRAAAEEVLGQARAQLGAVLLDVTPPDALVHVDGASEGRPASDSLWLDPGAHALRFVAGGHVEQEIGIDVAAGARETLRVNLHVVSAVSPPVVELGPRPAPTRPLVSPHVSPAQRAERAHRRRRVAMWSSLGLGVAAGVAAGALISTTTYRIRKIEAACDKVSTMECTQAQRNAADDDAKLSQLASGFYLSVGAGVASLLTAGGLWYWDRRATRSRVDVGMAGRTRVEVGVGARSLFVRGTF